MRTDGSLFQDMTESYTRLPRRAYSFNDDVPASVKQETVGDVSSTMHYYKVPVLRYKTFLGRFVLPM